MMLKLLLIIKKFLHKRLAKVSVIAMTLFLTACSGPFSTLDPAGPHARNIAWLWWGMFAFSVVVMAFMIWLWWRAMMRDGSATRQDDVQEKQNSWVIWGGLALPTAAITLLLAFGIPVGHKMLPFDDENLVHIQITAHQWFWQVDYPNTDITLIDEIHIPVDTQINFHVRSEDVIHSFWVPRLGGKIDAIPGRTNVLRLEASEVGRFDGQCAEYCGIAHTYMDFVVYAHSPENYQRWLEQYSGGVEAPRQMDAEARPDAPAEQQGIQEIQP